MRTTVRLDDDLLRQAKAAAARSGQTLTSLIEDALRAALQRGLQGATPTPLRLATFRGTGTLPGVDIDDSSALAEVMDQPATN